MGIENRARLYFTIGTAQSGKTTYCDQWVRGPFRPDDTGTHPDNVLFNYLTDAISVFRPRVSLSGDAFRQAVYGRPYHADGEAQVFACIEVAARALLRSNFDVIIDETHTTEESLRRILRIDPNAIPVFIDCPVEQCIERAVAKGDNYLVAVIKRHAGQLAVLRANWDETIKRLRDDARQRKEQDVCSGKSAVGCS